MKRIVVFILLFFIWLPVFSQESELQELSKMSIDDNGEELSDYGKKRLKFSIA